MRIKRKKPPLINFEIFVINQKVSASVRFCTDSRPPQYNTIFLTMSFGHAIGFTQELLQDCLNGANGITVGQRVNSKRAKSVSRYLCIRQMSVSIKHLAYPFLFFFLVLSLNYLRRVRVCRWITDEESTAEVHDSNRVTLDRVD